MRCSVVLVALVIAAALVGACGRDRKPQSRTAPTAGVTPDPRLQAAFVDIFTQAGAAAAKARELRENNLLSASRPDDSPASR